MNLEESITEWIGKWSYSIYLFHLVAIRYLERFDKPWTAVIGSLPEFALKVLLVLAACYCFYLAIELPSHWLARRAGSLCKRRVQVAVPS
jgi:peptidoglycan/LPS O-acetylase OafA/YrhL